MVRKNTSSPLLLASCNTDSSVEVPEEINDTHPAPHSSSLNTPLALSMRLSHIPAYAARY